MAEDGREKEKEKGLDRYVVIKKNYKKRNKGGKGTWLYVE